MESFEQKIKERNNLLKSQVESLTGRNELTEVIDALLKAGVAEEDLVEKAKYIRREADGKGGYKYIYSEPKEKQSGKKEEHEITFKNPDGSEGKRTIRIGNVTEKEAIDWAKEHIKGSDFKSNYEKENKIKTDNVEGEENNYSIKLDKNGEPDWNEYVRPNFVEITLENGKKIQFKEKQISGGKKVYQLIMYALDNYKSNPKAKQFIERLVEQAGKDLDKSSEPDLEKAKADKKQQKKIKKVMDEWKAGTLLDPHGNKITDRKQVLAVALSEAGLSKKK